MQHRRFRGKLDFEDKILTGTEFCIASLHDITIRSGTVEKNTAAMIGALNNPFVDILGHIDDKKMPVVFEEVVSEAAKLNKLIEINNNSILIRKGSKERVEEVAHLCVQKNVRVCVSSDAHFDTMVGNVVPALDMLKRIHFPDELVINRSSEAFESYLAERKARLQVLPPNISGRIIMK